MAKIEELKEQNNALRNKIEELDEENNNYASTMCQFPSVSKNEKNLFESNMQRIREINLDIKEKEAKIEQIAHLDTITRERAILLQRIEKILDENTLYKKIISYNLLTANEIQNNKYLLEFNMQCVKELLTQLRYFKSEHTCNAISFTSGDIEPKLEPLEQTDDFLISKWEKI